MIPVTSAGLYQRQIENAEEVVEMRRFEVEDRGNVKTINTVKTGTAVHARTCRGDALGQMDDLAEVLHDAGCGCGIGAARQNCWAWTSGRYHRAAKQAQRIGIHLASAA